MENASKALLMAGGILIALLIIGVLLLMFNQISTLKQSESSNQKNTQLVKFNMDFERYLDDSGISGSDIVTLANKISDYNDKKETIHEVSNSVDYSIKMELYVEMTGFKSKYGYSNGIFKDVTYVVSNDNPQNDLKVIINKYNPIFNGNNKKIITQLTDIYTRGANDNEKKITEALGGESWKNKFKIDEIKNYKEYTEFRTSTFVPEKDSDYKNGQIQKLYFKFKN